jgi:P4 family phage/plasmid primase-like protien
LDFKFPYETTERKHTDETIWQIILLYMVELQTMVSLPADTLFDVFVMHKATVAQLEDKCITKDGIHIIIGLNIDVVVKQILRKRVIAKLGPILASLPLTNSMEDVVDLTICKGTTNWQVYGSRKPGYNPYLLTHHYQVVVEPHGIENIVMPVEAFNLEQNIGILSARYTGFPTPELLEAFKPEHLQFTTTSTKPTPKPSTPTSDLVSFRTDPSCIAYSEITDADSLRSWVDKIMSNLTLDEYYLKETHDYAQILPDRFYRAGGSHEDNTKLAFALKHTDNRMFLTWVMVRSKSTDFSYSEIPELRKRWDNSFNKCPDSTLTRRSIIYWAKQENPTEYQRILENTATYYIEQSMIDGSDWDLAMVVYQLYKDKYICASTSEHVWYTFQNHRWNRDKGNSLRIIISTEVFMLYKKKAVPVMAEKTTAQAAYDVALDQKDTSKEELSTLKAKLETLKLRCNTINRILDKLKNTTSKNHLLVEAASLFYDADFMLRADANPSLLCFTNGVWDFSTSQFRPGIPQDYITKTTNLPYIHAVERDSDMMSQITVFMQQLFTSPGLNRYMWDHLASCLVGGNKNQTFNMYIGCGSNGKSKLTELMSKCFGDYKGTVPISLVTDKRPSIGGTSSELMNLKGIRYAVMQEPTKSNCVLNEGVMKEMTGPDPISARGLYRDSESFTPQLTLVVCSNILFDINSTDNGTWRRIRVCKFSSRFVDLEDDPTAVLGNNVFARDCELDTKIHVWAPTFMSMLVSRYLETKGRVADCAEVMEESRQYRDRENHVSTFINENLEEMPASGVTKQSQLKINYIYTQFKQWCAANTSTNPKAIPKRDELADAISQRWKKCSNGGWNIRFKHHEDQVDEAFDV